MAAENEEKPQPGYQRVEVQEPPVEETPVEETPEPEEAPAETPEEAPEEQSSETTAEDPNEEDAEEESSEEAPAEEATAEEEAPAEPKIPDHILKAANFARELDQEMAQDPVLFRAFLENRKRKNFKLLPEHEAFLAQKEQPAEEKAPEKPSAPALESYDDVLAKARKMQLEGREVEASDMLAQWHSKSASIELRNSLNEIKATQQKSESDRQRERDEERRRIATRTVKEGFLSLAKSHPDLFVADKNPENVTGISGKDPKFALAFFENVQLLGSKASLEDCVTFTLAKMGRALPKPKAKVQTQKPGAKPAAPKLSGERKVEAQPKWGGGSQRIIVHE